MKKNRITLLLASLMLSGHLWAAEAYDINKSYPGGSQVNYNGQVFEAKWWVNPGQTPGMAVANEWDTPWKLIGEGEVTPPDNGDDNDKPTPPTPPRRMAALPLFT